MQAVEAGHSNNLPRLTPLFVIDSSASGHLKS